MIRGDERARPARSSTDAARAGARRDQNPARRDQNPQRNQDSWFADTVERLFSEFESRQPLVVIAAVTRRCRAELEGCGLPAAALPELVERLARHRLTQRVRELPPRPDGP